MIWEGSGTTRILSRESVFHIEVKAIAGPETNGGPGETVVVGAKVDLIILPCDWIVDGML